MNGLRGALHCLRWSPESPMSCRLPEQHKKSLPIPLWECKELKIMTSRVTVEEPSSLSLSAYGKARSTVQGSPLSPEELRKTHAYWRACSYLALGMIYLQANPLLKEPLKPEHIKNRLLGHWGSSPGLAFTYIHLNRLIKKLDLDVIFMPGPGHEDHVEIEFLDEPVQVAVGERSESTR